MDSLNLSIQPTGSLAVDTAPAGTLELFGSTEQLTLGTAPAGNLDLANNNGYLALSSEPAGTIDVPNFLLVKDGLLDEYSDYLKDENGDNLVWQ